MRAFIVHPQSLQASAQPPTRSCNYAAKVGRTSGTCTWLNRILRTQGRSLPPRKAYTTSRSDGRRLKPLSSRSSVGEARAAEAEAAEAQRSSGSDTRRGGSRSLGERIARIPARGLVEGRGWLDTRTRHLSLVAKRGRATIQLIGTDSFAN